MPLTVALTRVSGTFPTSSPRLFSVLATRPEPFAAGRSSFFPISARSPFATSKLSRKPTIPPVGAAARKIFSAPAVAASGPVLGSTERTTDGSALETPSVAAASVACAPPCAAVSPRPANVCSYVGGSLYKAFVCDPRFCAAFITLGIGLVSCASATLSSAVLGPSGVRADFAATHILPIPLESAFPYLSSPLIVAPTTPGTPLYDIASASVLSRSCVSTSHVEGLGKFDAASDENFGAVSFGAGA